MSYSRDDNNPVFCNSPVEMTLLGRYSLILMKSKNNQIFFFNYPSTQKQNNDMRERNEMLTLFFVALPGGFIALFL